MLSTVPARVVDGSEATTGSTASLTLDQAPAKKKTSTREKLSRSERRERLSKLPEKWHQFLDEVDPIIHPEELDAFLRLESDAQREFFVESFWLSRDSNPRTARNEYREEYDRLLAFARSNFKSVVSDRSRMLLTAGMPVERVEIRCPRYFQPLEVWYYPWLEGLGRDVLFIFYNPRVGIGYRLWMPMFGSQQQNVKELLSLEAESAGGLGSGVNSFQYGCRDGDLVASAIAWGLSNPDMSLKVFERPEVDTEHAARTMRHAVLRNPDAPQFETDFELAYPGSRGTRTIVNVSMSVPKDALTRQTLAGHDFYNLDVTGEVLLNDSFFETFRYRFDYPAGAVGETIPVTFERFLRPNDYSLRIKILDVNGGAESVLEQQVSVPAAPRAPETVEQEAAREKITSLQRQFFEEGSNLAIVPIPGRIQTGLTRINTIVTGDEITTVEFWLDGEKIMTRNEPPFDLEIDLGSYPLMKTLRAVGLGEDGQLVSGDELVINKGIDPFHVHIASPRLSRKLTGPVRTVVDIDVPRGEAVESVEIFLNEDRVATIFDPPWITTVQVPEDLEVGYLRAVATLKGETPRTAEDLVFLNRPDFLQELDVHLVELPTTVLRSGRPVDDLELKDFAVFDEGSPVEIARFERVSDVALSVGIAIDSSASMEEKMRPAQEAAASFFEQVLGERDRAFLVGFSEVPIVMNRWTSDLERLATALASLRPEATTALYDAVVYSLYNFQGVDGQKALIVLSDGEDTASQFQWEQTLQYARRSGVPIYSIGIGIPITAREARGALARLASETGGRAWFPADVSSLSPIYRDIETELRSQYLLGFYPPPDVADQRDWREIEVKVDGAEVRTIRGYYP